MQADLFEGGERIELRDYQLRAIDQLEEHWQLGTKHVLLVAPTGAGKTIIGVEIIRRAVERGERTLFLAPRRELIYQTVEKMHRFDIHHGVILAGHPDMNLYAQTQVASVDTLIARALRKQRIQLPAIQLVIVDEAHVGLTERRQELLRMFPDAKIVGLTATPCRSDGKALGQVYDEMVEVASVAELTEQGYLVPGRYFSVSDPDLKGVRTLAGDYHRGDLERAMNKPKLVGDIVEHWLKHAHDKRTVVFASSINHSAALANEFVSHGVTAEHVDASTPDHEREAIFDRFRTGRTQVLCNCTLASIGFDLPELDCVVFARPTKSLGLYLQMLGRGLRPAEDKTECLVLDHSGCVRRFGFATEERYWTLHGKYAQDEEKVAKAKAEKEQKDLFERVCPECQHVHAPAPECPNCQYVYPKRGVRLTTFAGELVEMGGGITSRNKKGSVTQKAEWYLQLVGYADMKGYKRGWASFKFKEKFGEWPSYQHQMHAEKYGGVTPLPEVMRWIQSRMIAYRRMKEKERHGNQAEA